MERTFSERLVSFTWKALVVVAVLLAVYTWLALRWSYANGERAGYVQKLSLKGWVCKTWEGELAMVNVPGALTEKFVFTVRDDSVANKINQLLGKRVVLHYEQHVGVPTSCFGDTSYFITDAREVPEGGTAEPAPPVPTVPAAPTAPAPPAVK
jgi:hypothetical protein